MEQRANAGKSSSIYLSGETVHHPDEQIRGGAASTWKPRTLLQSQEKLLKEEEKAEHGGAHASATARKIELNRETRTKKSPNDAEFEGDLSSTSTAAHPRTPKCLEAERDADKGGENTLRSQEK
jgi:hypothetical protein